MSVEPIEVKILPEHMDEKPVTGIFDAIKCVVCRNDTPELFKIRYVKDTCAVIECRNCSFHFIPPYYRRGIDYSHYKSEEVAAEVKKSAQWLKIERNLLRYKLLRKYQDSKRVFDVGAGFGHFLLAGRELGYEVAGIELSKANVDFMREELRLPVVHADFLTYECDEKYDCITFWDVLEHIDEADLAVEKAAAMLGKGGIIMIQVPQWDGFFARILKDRWWSMGLDHVNYFTRKTIRRLLNRYGFEVRTIKSSIELKNILNNFLIPTIFKRKMKAEKKWTAAERQRQFNKLTAKPQWLLKIFVVVHNVVYRLLSMVHIGNEMIVVAEKR